MLPLFTREIKLASVIKELKYVLAPQWDVSFDILRYTERSWEKSNFLSVWFIVIQSQVPSTVLPNVGSYPCSSTSSSLWELPSPLNGRSGKFWTNVHSCKNNNDNNKNKHFS